MSVTAPVDLVNLALGHLGIGREVQAIDTEASAEAAAGRRYYAPARDAVLRDFAWGFAMTIAPLSLVQAAPNVEWAFSYRYPVDCLELHRILSGAARLTAPTLLFADVRYGVATPAPSRVPYRLAADAAGTLILTDQDAAQAEWTMRVTDVTRFPDDFAEALSRRLAAMMAPRLTGGDPTKLMERNLAVYQSLIGMARAKSANEEQPDPIADSEFIRGRD